MQKVAGVYLNAITVGELAEISWAYQANEIIKRADAERSHGWNQPGYLHLKPPPRSPNSRASK
jgi:hypothetical protein